MSLRSLNVMPYIFVRREEDAVVQDAVELEVGPDLRLVEVVLGLADLLGVEVPVGGGRRGSRPPRVDLLLHVRRLAARLLRRGGHEVGHELLGVLRRLRHLVVEDIGGVVGKPRSFAFSRAQLREARDDRPRVVGAAVVAARREASRIFSRSARFSSDARAGCCVVFWSGRTHWPWSFLVLRRRRGGRRGRPRRGRRARALPSTTTADALVSARSLSPNCVVSSRAPR